MSAPAFRPPPVGGGGKAAGPTFRPPGSTTTKASLQTKLDSMEGAKKKGLTGWIGRLGKEVGDAALNLPKGAVGLVDEAGKVARLPGTVAANVGLRMDRDALNKNRLLRQVTLPSVTPRKGEAALDTVKSSLPVATGLVEGAKQTAGRLTNPKKLVRDYTEHPGQSLITDAANLLPLLKGASAGLEAVGAGEGRLASAAEKASQVAEHVVDLPAKPYRAVAAPVKSALKQTYAEASAPAAEGVVADTLRLTGMTPEQRAARAAVRGAKEKVAAQAPEVVRNAQRVEKVLTDPAEQQAYALTREGEAQALAARRKAALIEGDPEAFSRFVDEHYKGAVTPEAAHMAADVADGGLPEVQAKFAKADSLTKLDRDRRVAEYVNEDVPQREWQLGFEPHGPSVSKVATKEMGDVQRAAAVAEKLRTKADEARARAELASLTHGNRITEIQGGVADKAVAAMDELRALADEGAPKRSLKAAVDKLVDRPARQGAKAAEYGATSGRRLATLEERAQQAEQQAARAEELVARRQLRAEKRMQNAEHDVANAPARTRPALITGRAVDTDLAETANRLRGAGKHAEAAAVDRVASEVATTLKDLQAQGIDPEHFIHVKLEAPSLASKAQSAGDLALRKARSERVRKGVTNYDRSLRAQAQGEIDELTLAIRRNTAKSILDMPFAVRLNEGPLKGIKTAAEAEKLGFEAWDPRALFGKKTSVANLDDLDLQLGVKGADKFVPKAVADTLRSQFNVGSLEKFLRLYYDTPTRAWKALVLPLSPAWITGNVFGNAMMATVGAGVGPVELLKQIREVRRYMKANDGEMPGPARLYSSGLTHGEHAYLQGEVGGPRTPVGKVIQAGYNANEFVDNVGRSAVYLAKKAKGMSDEAAVESALKAMGDFSKMTKFEQQAVRRVLPFYAWTRHITKLAFSLPVESPLRTAWTLHLSELAKGDDPVDGMPDWMKPSVTIGGKVVSLSRFGVFGDAGAVFSARGVTRAMNPLLKLEESIRTGVNPDTGSPYTRPPGTGRHDANGKPLPTAPGIATLLRRNIPQTRTLDAITGRDRVVRYDTGDVIYGKNGQPLPAQKSLVDTAASVAGASTMSLAKAKAIADARKKRQQREAKDRESYLKKKRQHFGIK